MSTNSGPAARTELWIVRARSRLFLLLANVLVERGGPVRQHEVVVGGRALVHVNFALYMDAGLRENGVRILQEPVVESPCRARHEQ